MVLSLYHWLGIASTICAVVALGMWAGRRVKSSSDFLVAGGRMGPVLVAGSMLGTVFGGSSTVGTVEMAFKYGLSAWWWTLGSGIGCFIFGCYVYRVVRHGHIATPGDLLERLFGQKTRVIVSLALLVSMFLSLVPNVLSALAILSSVSRLSTGVLILVTIICISAYVVFGGMWGASVVGLLKISLTAVCLVVSVAVAWSVTGGPVAIAAVLPAHPWFNLLGRGVWADLGSGAGIILGLLSTQTYLQALAAARSDSAARAGAFASAVVAPMLGLMGVFVGLSMRTLEPGISSSQALPLFILHNLPPVAAGVALGTFFLAGVGTAAGLALGIGTLISADLLGQIRTGRLGIVLGSQRVRLVLARTAVFASIALGAAAATLVKPAFILQLSFVSLGIRAGVATPAFLAAARFGSRLAPRAGLLSVAGGIAGLLVGRFAMQGVDPVLPAILCSTACLVFPSIFHGLRAGTSSRM